MKAPQAGGAEMLGLVYLALIVLVVVVPFLLGRRPHPPDSPDSGSDGGPGRGPEPPPDRPTPPLGGLPLPNAVQSNARIRDHRPPVRRLSRRRGGRERDPHRTPIRSQ